MPSQLGLTLPAGGTGGQGRWAEMPGVSSDAGANLVIPAAALARAGLDPAGDWICALADGGLTLIPDTPRKVYVEATTLCNLSCATCIRNAWDEPMGHMPLARYRRLLEGLPPSPRRPITIAFAGFGEPLVHPDFLE